MPFCAYGLNFGDVVKALPKAPDLKHEIIEVIAKSGHHMVRVCFMVARDQQQEHLEQIESFQVWVAKMAFKPSFFHKRIKNLYAVKHAMFVAPLGGYVDQ